MLPAAPILPSRNSFLAGCCDAPVAWHYFPGTRRYVDRNGAGGSLVVGPTCLGTDTPDTFHFAVSAASGALSTTGTGPLFTAIYNITGTTPTAGVLIGFQTGCGTPYSPTSDPPLSVTVTKRFS